MKKEVMLYIRSLGGIPMYCGNTKKEYTCPSEKEKKDWNKKIEVEKITLSNKTTMFIHNDKAEGKQSIEECILNKFGFTLSFKLVTQ